MNNFIVTNKNSINNLVAYCRKNIEIGNNLLNPLKKNKGNRNCYNLNKNMFYSTDMAAKRAMPIMSLKDIVNYKTGIIKTNPYQGLLKGKEDSEFKFGNAKLYPSPSEYGKFEDICD
jgi:hypothetical protein